MKVIFIVKWFYKIVKDFIKKPKENESINIKL